MARTIVPVTATSASWKGMAQALRCVLQVDRFSKISSSYGQLPAAKKSNDHKGILETIKVLLTKGIKSLDVKGVNFANGFLSEDLTLVPHDPAHGMTYTLPFRYMPDTVGLAPCSSSSLRTAGRTMLTTWPRSTLYRKPCV
jgi:phage/plasmid-associated DNA primase